MRGPFLFLNSLTKGFSVFCGQRSKSLYFRCFCSTGVFVVRRFFGASEMMLQKLGWWTNDPTCTPESLYVGDEGVVQ